MSSPSPLAQHPSTKQFEDLVFTRLRQYVPVALNNYTSDRYENLVKMLRNPENNLQLTTNYPVLFKLLANIAYVASRLDAHNHSTLVELLFSFDGRAPDYVVKAWCTLMFSMCTSNVAWVEQALLALCKVLCGKYSLELFSHRHHEHQQQLQNNQHLPSMNDIIANDPSILTSTMSNNSESDESALISLDILQQCIHTTISLILSHIPMSSSRIISAVVETGPHYTASLLQQCLWVEFVLRICETAPSLRDALLTTILEKLLSLDIHLSRSITRVFSVLSKEYVTTDLQANQTSLASSSPSTHPASPLLNTSSGSPNPTQSLSPLPSFSHKHVVKSELFTEIDSIQHQSTKINNITVTTPTDSQYRINLDTIFDRNEEMRSIDGLLLILSNYLWLVATTVDFDEQVYDDVITIAHIHNGSPQTITGSKVELPDFAPLKLDHNTDVQPKPTKKSKRVKTEVDGRVKIEVDAETAKSAPISAADQDLLKIMAQPMKKGSGALSGSLHPLPTATDSDKDSKEALPPPLLRLTTSERVQHDAEINFEIKSLLNEQRGRLDEDGELDSAKSSPHTGPFFPLSGLVPPKEQIKISKLNDDVFGSIFRTFNRVVLPTQGSHFIQWLLFYQCSFRFEYVEVLLRLLTDRLYSPRSNNTIRVSCIWYIASLLVRSKFIRVASAASSLSNLAMWAHQYMDTFVNTALKQQQANSAISAHNTGSSGQNGSVMGTDNFQSSNYNLYSPENHLAFFASIEALLYILTHRPDLVKQVKPIQLVQEGFAVHVETESVNSKTLQNQNQADSASMMAFKSKIQQRRSVLTPMQNDMDVLDTSTTTTQSSNQKATLPSAKKSKQRLQQQQQQQQPPLQNFQTEFSPVLSPLLSDSTIPALSMVPAQLQPLSSIPSNRSVSITETSALKMSDLISKQIKPLIVSTQRLTLTTSTQDPLHIIALLTSVLRPAQFLSPLLVERYLTLYHNIACVTALLDPVFQSNTNIHQYVHRPVKPLTQHHSNLNTSNDSMLLSRLLPNKANSLVLPTVYITSTQQTINLSSCISNNSASVQQTTKLLESLSQHQREILSTYIRQQMQLFTKYGPSSQTSTANRPQMSALFDDTPISSANPPITLVDLQNVGIYPIIHPQSPLIQYSRADSRPPSYATLIGNSKRNSKRPNQHHHQQQQQQQQQQVSTLKSLQDKKLATGRSIAELDAEDASRRQDLTEFDFLAGLTTLQVQLSFIEFPFDPFFPPSLREQLLPKYNLTFDIYRHHARHWRDYSLNIRKTFTYPVSLPPLSSIASKQPQSAVSSSNIFNSNNSAQHNRLSAPQQSQDAPSSAQTPKPKSVFNQMVMASNNTSNTGKKQHKQQQQQQQQQQHAADADINFEPLNIPLQIPLKAPTNNNNNNNKTGSKSTTPGATPPTRSPGQLFDQMPASTSPFASPLFKASSIDLNQQSGQSFQSLPLFGSPFYGQGNAIQNSTASNISPPATFDYSYLGMNEADDVYAYPSNPAPNTIKNTNLHNHAKSRQSLNPALQQSSMKRKTIQADPSKNRQSIAPAPTTKPLENGVPQTQQKLKKKTRQTIVSSDTMSSSASTETEKSNPVQQTSQQAQNPNNRKSIPAQPLQTPAKPSKASTAPQGISVKQPNPPRTSKKAKKQATNVDIASSEALQGKQQQKDNAESTDSQVGPTPAKKRFLDADTNIAVPSTTTNPNKQQQKSHQQQQNSQTPVVQQKTKKSRATIVIDDPSGQQIVQLPPPPPPLPLPLPLASQPLVLEGQKSVPKKQKKRHSIVPTAHQDPINHNQ